MFTDAFREQKRESDPLELELQAAVSCLTWVLGTRLFLWKTISLATQYFFFFKGN